MTHIGWREWLSLPDLGVEWIKAKVDTGARSSALHATDIEPYDAGNGTEWVRFTLFPRQRSRHGAIEARGALIDRRPVRSSSGTVEVRPVIATSAIVGEAVLKVELTLTSRDDMGFRMLLGRQALRRAFVVNPARSYLSVKPPRSVITRNWQVNGRRRKSA